MVHTIVMQMQNAVIQKAVSHVIAMMGTPGMAQIAKVTMLLYYSMTHYVIF